MSTTQFKYANMSISEGTMKTVDLLCAFVQALDDLDRDACFALLDSYGLCAFTEKPAPKFWDAWHQADPERAEELLAELFEALDEYSPHDFKFGAHKGDGACFGFWEEASE